MTVDPSGTWTTKTDSYSTAGQATQTSIEVPAGLGALSGTYVSTAEYDAAGNATAIGIPATGDLPAETLTYGYSALGNPSTVTTTVGATPAVLVSSTGFDDNGRIASRVLGAGPNQVQRTYTYENTGRLASTKAQFIGGPVAQHDQYSYDDDGLVTAVADNTTAQSECFRYDHLQRLTDAWTRSTCTSPDDPAGAAGPNPYKQTFQYDRIGNLTKKTTDGAALTYSYGAGAAGPHAVTSTVAGTTATTYGYDGNGAMTASTAVTDLPGTQNDTTATTSHTWDAQRRLVATEVTRETGGAPDGDPVDDGSVHLIDGTRILRTAEDGTTTLFLQNQEVTLAPGASPTTTRHLTAPGAEVATRTASGLDWFIADAPGNASMTIDAGTTTTRRQRYLPYGEIRAGSQKLGTEQGYLNKVKDETTGLIITDNRAYHPVLSRFISPDPLLDASNPQTLNGYTYASNSPVSFKDPSGLFSVDSIARQLARNPFLNAHIRRPQPGQVAGQIRTYRTTVRRGQVKL